MTAPAASWLDSDVPADNGFGLENLPYGVFSTQRDGRPRTGVAIGDRVLDLAGLTDDPVHATGSLNAFLALGPRRWQALRADLVGWLTEERHRALVEPHLVPVEEARLHLPVAIADYVDFYSSRHHAENLGHLFRPGGAPLTPNWLHLPLGYHGRSGTVVVSGTPVARPHGQRRGAADGPPTFGPSLQLDIEAEIGFVVGTPSPLGRPVALEELDQHVFGVCLVNDWSARDLQSWEYVPLGPFLGKSFLTSVSPWVVPLTALQAARIPPPPREVALLPYLDDAATAPWGLDIQMEVRINGHVVSRPPFGLMYWTPAQQLAHLTVNGASLRTGDLFASGTVSGPEQHQRGSLIELTWGGREPLELPDGSVRTFLQDGDRVSITATATGVHGGTVSLGAVTGRVQPPRPMP
ncbi:fumarylacetoacetase [Parafrankia colletiae]|uniref:fumarylacetoacetase n=1 Tax=Parafrankia colletiae TaxID=573497 RepID=A0A1S1QDA0_9ACTN|nr:fumarylacetoacetase [Parafrankia colletiae]MCK9902573.1 fumarylacetoacetase [Frankia sp. Cpl3]OHV31451.1 fumarylacetoacetase [Parafrankia colletiae]